MSKNVQSTNRTRTGGDQMSRLQSSERIVSAIEIFLPRADFPKLGCFAQFAYLREPIYASLDYLVTTKCQQNLAQGVGLTVEYY